MPEHATLTGTSLHEDKRIKEPCRAATTANLTITSPGASIDGVAMNNGDRFLAKNQSAGAENGIYVWNGAASAATRASDADSASDFITGFKVFVTAGTINAGAYFTYTTAGAITLGSTSLTFTTDGASISYAATPSTQAFGDAAAGGAATTVTRGDHKHAMPDGVAVQSVGSLVGTRPTINFVSGATVTDNSGSSRVDVTVSGGGSGGSGAMVPISTQVPVGASSVTFGVPAGFKDVRLTGQARSDTFATIAGLLVRFNSDAGSNYYVAELYNDSATTSASDESIAGTAAQIGYATAATAPANAPGHFTLDIPNYAGTTFYKTFSARNINQRATSSGNTKNDEFVGQWSNAAAITSMTLILSAGVFVTGTTFTLWGIADTAPVLLTANSNLLYETTLSAAAASIDTGTLSQAYRDLQITIHDARGSTAAQSTNIRLRANGDGGANYNYQTVTNSGTTTTTNSNTGQTTFMVGDMTAASATASFASGGDVMIYGYSSGSLFKTIMARMHLSASTQQNNTHHGWWASTAAITSIQFTPAAGNFNAGTTIRVYGLPAASGGASVGTGTRLRLSGNQSTTTGTATAITWDTEDSDADNQHYTSAANLTGTVSKTAASATLTGSSTAFTTELSVGQVISVPGTAAEKRVVIAIASNTSLTVNSAFVNSASGQTAARVNSAVVFRQSGFYTLEANIYSAALASGAVTLAYYLNSLTTATSGTAIAQRDPTAQNASAGYDLMIQRQFQQWDFVEVIWTQNAGTVNVLADERTHWSISARPTVVAALPYVKVIDSKAQNTAGGTFTSGADQTRTLNTVDSDTAGMATLSSNQITLGPGTYRYRISAPAYQTGAHQAFLYNATATAEIKRGSTESSGASSATITASMIVGKMTLTVSSALEVRHRCTTTSSTNGFGLPANFGAEVYTIAEFWREG